MTRAEVRVRGRATHHSARITSGGDVRRRRSAGAPRPDPPL